MNEITQNVYLWVLPGKETVTRRIEPGSFVTYEVIEPLDGVFYYDIFLRYRCGEGGVMSVHPNGAPLFTYEKLEPSETGKWIYCGTPMFAKGVQSLRVFNRGEVPLELDAVVMTYDKQYVSSGEADADLALLREGTEPALKRAAALMGKELDSRKNDENLKKLAQAGFLERPDQAVYTTDCRNGVPMGGIGAGKIELDGDGVFTAITINNNFDVPLYKTEGSFFAVRWNGGAKLLQTVNYNPYPFPTVKKVNFTGTFPSAVLRYPEDELPVRLSLRAFSPLVPNNVRDSAMPCVIFEFEAENTGAEEQEISLLFSWENLIGSGGSMRYKSRNPSIPTINIMNTWNPGFTWSNRAGTFQTAPASGEIGFSASSDHGNPASFGNYTMLTEDGEGVTCKRSWRVSSEGERLWKEFTETGELRESGEEQTGSDGDPVAGAVCRRVTVRPGETKKVPFVFAWYMPRLVNEAENDTAPYYTNFYQNSSEAARDTLERRDELRKGTLEIFGLLSRSTLPEWLKQKLVNDMFPILTCSYFTKEGYFSINEAPTGMMGCLGTMDQRLACNVIYTNFYRELDKSELNLFALTQGKDGSISHDLGAGTFEITERGGSWSDLASSFLLQIYKHYLYTGDREFFDAMYPRIKRAVAWQKTIDYDGNGIPDVGAGNGTTYDTYHWYGTSAFVAGLWLAELKACMRMAELQGDDSFKEECEAMFLRAQKSMIGELWTDRYDCGGYFKSYYDAAGTHRTENCFIAQLAGQWAADLMDLGDLLPEEKIRETIRTITRQNVRLEGMPGMNDETTPKGEYDWFGYTFVQYDEVYYGCLAIYRGFVEEGLECFRRVYEMNKHAPWNVPLTQHADGHIIGLPYYMTNPASFFILEALSGYVPDVVGGKMKLAPRIGKEERLSVPLFSPSLWIWFDYEQAETGRTYRVKTLKIIGKEQLSFERLITELPEGKKLCGVRCAGREIPYTVRGSRVEVEVSWALKEGTEETVELLLEPEKQEEEKKC